MKGKFSTIKVLNSSISGLNLIAAITGEHQYQVVERLVEKEKTVLAKPVKKK